MSSFPLFGQQAQQPQQQQSSIFGQPATQQPQQQGSIFGQPTAQQPQLQSSPFGNNPQQQGSIFGQPATQQPQQQGSIFGQPTTQQPQQQQGNIFGQSTAQQPQQQGTAGLPFGAQQQQQQQQQSPAFGKPALSLFQPLQPGGNTFGGGQTAQQNPGGNLFGAQQNTGGGGSGIFGGQQPQQQQPQQQQQGGLLGQPTQQGSGAFGGQQQPGGASLFGNAQPGGGGTWGSLQSQQGGGIFGQPQSQMGGLTAFGQQSQNPMMMQSSQMQQQSANLIVDKLRRINNAWDPGHPDYAFKFYLYNHVGEDRANLYQKPPADDLAEWEKAWTERPTKGSVPVIAKGFKDLDSRVKTQEQQVNLFRYRLHEIQDKLTALQNRHDLVTSIKLEDCRRRHAALSRRALSLASKVQVLKNRGYALQPEEELLKKRLEGLARAVWDPAVRGRVNEIWARMMVVGEQARVMEENASKVEIVRDEKQLQTAAKLLQSNAAGLEHLTKEVKEIEKALGEWEEEQKLRPQGF